MNIILGIAFVIGLSSFVLTVFRDVGLRMIFNPDALLIVVGGSVLAVFLGFPLKGIKETVHDIVSAFKPSGSRDTVMKDVLEAARIYRRADIRSLERWMKGVKDDFLRFGMSLLTSQRSSEEIRNIMEREMSIRVMRYNSSQNMLKTIARLTPSFGLAGTVISLIKMFKDFQSIDAIPPLMAVALMSTFYGVVISNLLMLPLCAKLKDRALMSETLMSLTIEGIESIQNREHPLKIEEKIMGYQGIKESAFRLSVIPMHLRKVSDDFLESMNSKEFDENVKELSSGRSS